MATNTKDFSLKDDFGSQSVQTVHHGGVCCFVRKHEEDEEDGGIKNGTGSTSTLKDERGHVQKACENYTYNETISNCELFSGQKYRLLCESNDPDCKPNPQIVKFYRDYGPNFHPSFEVNLKTSDKVKLTLLNKKGKVVWRSPDVSLTGSTRAFSKHVSNRGSKFCG